MRGRLVSPKGIPILGGRGNETYGLPFPLCEKKSNETAKGRTRHRYKLLGTDPWQKHSIGSFEPLGFEEDSK
jgi:hypothetical protein